MQVSLGHGKRQFYSISPISPLCLGLKDERLATKPKVVLRS